MRPVLSPDSMRDMEAHYFSETGTPSIELMERAAEALAAEVLRLATRGGAQAFGLDAGEIRVGAAADFLILDPDAVPLVPGFNRTSDLVYAADPSCLDTVVCAGRVLMEGGVVPGEEEIVAAARQAARLLV